MIYYAVGHLFGIPDSRVGHDGDRVSGTQVPKKGIETRNPPHPPPAVPVIAPVAGSTAAVTVASQKTAHGDAPRVPALGGQASPRKPVRRPGLNGMVSAHGSRTAGQDAVLSGCFIRNCSFPFGANVSGLMTF
jgi:hypothetical protein